MPLHPAKQFVLGINGAKKKETETKAVVSLFVIA
jgi:hypothetical protein